MFTIYDYEDIRNFFKQDAIFIGLYIGVFDFPTLHRLLGIDFSKIKFYDTLLLSQYVMPNRENYKLKSFGEEYGVLKTKVKQEQWDGDINDLDFRLLMQERCEGDVKITANLWASVSKRLSVLYDNSEASINSVLTHLSFKASRAYMQMVNPCTFDEVGAMDLLQELVRIKEEKVEVLRAAMPPNRKYSIKTLFNNMTIKKGGYSAEALKWFKFLEDNNIPKDNIKPVKYI